MFTGIVETQGIVKKVIEKGANKTFWIKSPISSKLKPDQSVAHDGACLTVEEVKDNMHRVTAIQETLEKTDLHQWKEGTPVNLERSVLPSTRVDGHFVQGHVDATARCKKVNMFDSKYFFRKAKKSCSTGCQKLITNACLIHQFSGKKAVVDSFDSNRQWFM